MLGVPFWVLGGLGWPLWSKWVAYENVKKTFVFTPFSAFGSSWRAPSGVVFSFFRFPIVFTTVFSVSDRFFSFSDRIYVRFSVSDRFFSFFRFSRVFTGDFFSTSVFTGAIRLHAARESAQLSANQQRIIPGQELRVIKGVIQGIRSPLSIYPSHR